MSMRDMLTIIVLSIVIIWKISAASAATTSIGTFTPKNPANAGFSLIFDDEFSNANTIDLHNKCSAGHHWYLRKFFGYATEPAANISVSKGILTISPTSNTENYNLSTTCPANNSNGYVGTAFGAPAAAYYFEARIAFY